MKFKPLHLALVVSLFSSQLWANDNHAQIISGLKQVAPELSIDSIKPSPIPGLYEVLLGTEILYISGDGRYILSGDLYDTQKQKNLSELEKAAVRKTVLENIPKEQLIEFSPNETKHSIYVFTDISCGYCRKLHQDVPKLNDMGISVKYLAYPRAGANSNSGYELSAVWCSKDKNKAMTSAKSGHSIDDVLECNDPVASHYKVGNQLGVRGTPAIFLEDGTAIPGYYPPDELIKLVRR